MSYKLFLSTNNLTKENTITEKYFPKLTKHCLEFPFDVWIYELSNKSKQRFQHPQEFISCEKKGSRASICKFSGYWRFGTLHMSVAR